MKKLNATLRSAPAASIEVPEDFPPSREEAREARKRGEEPKTRSIERSGFGALRLFPGVPRAISEDELEYIRGHRADVGRRLTVSPYVESKRLDYRGKTEADIEALAEGEGIGHLGFAQKVERLEESGKLTRPKAVESSETRPEGKAKKPPTRTPKPKPPK